MKSNDPSGFALDAGRSTLVCLLPVGSVGVKMMQSQRDALEKTKGSDPVELSALPQSDRKSLEQLRWYMQREEETDYELASCIDRYMPTHRT